MPLTPSTRLGPYEIQSPLGAGGMGEVYRAKDTRLGRDVAIKILPVALSNDPVRKQRFDREAKTISGLNHPNICTLHDIGSQDGVDYLVMECVEGETLAKRLEKGPLPLEQVLKYGAQVADALDKAHRAGIVHRDLKPGNIMVTSSGTKLLDFGLAKPAAVALTGMTLTAAATKTTPVTQEGMIVGTFQYMSPEQIEGKDVDGRSDIFSLGAVLYEMLTGQKAFQGKSQLSVASAILEKEPAPINSIKPMTPPALDHAIRRCLAKEPERRWQSAGDLAGELQWIAESGSQTVVPAPEALRSRWRERLAWALAAALGIAAALALWRPWRSSLKPPRDIRVTAEIGADAVLKPTAGPVVALSHDGSRLAFVARGADQNDRIYVRPLDELHAAPLAGTEGAVDLFFSPDGEWIAFFAGGKLKKIPAGGGATVTLCSAPSSRGGSWGEDGTIIFAPEAGSGLLRIPSSGGTPEPLTALDTHAGEHSHRWPQVLPGGKAVLFTSSFHAGLYEDADIAVYSVPSRQLKRVYSGGFCARYLPSGHLVYIHEGTLFAVPFNLKRLEVTGQATPMVEGLATNPALGGASFSISETGTLIYAAGAGYSLKVSLAWMDHEGKFQALREIPDNYSTPAFSPDGRRLALAIRAEGRSDLWIYDWARNTLSRLTFTAQDNMFPVWTPDGQRIAYAGWEKGGPSNVYWKRADGSGDAQRLTESTNSQRPYSWSPDGKTLGFVEELSGNSWNIMTLSVEGDEKSGWKIARPKAFLSDGPFVRGQSAFSPDGRWLAYHSNESGSSEIYVRPYPGPGGQWQVSTEGGVMPQWSRNGKELFYRTPAESKIMVVSYTVSRDSFQADKPRLWSPGQFTSRGSFPNFALHPDGKRFVVLKAPEETQLPINKFNFIFNFFEELRRKVPSAKN